MSDQSYQLAAIAIYFAAMLAVGFYAYRRTAGHEDYMLAGRRLPSWAAALSAGASDMSGWLMMGLPGAIYLAGLIEAWIAVGLTMGAYLNWRFVAPRLRAYSQVSRNSITVPSFLGNRLRDSSRALRIVSGAIILIFFTFYVSSGMVAGGVFFESTFGTGYVTGMVIVGAVTLLYTMFGGFLGASLTDVVQGLMMMVALIVVPVIAVIALGGPAETLAAITEAGPGHLSLTAGSALTGATVLSIVSAVAWGLGYFGQPHIIIRFMALTDPAAARPARRMGIGWMLISLTGAVAGGLIGLAYVTTTGAELSDPETVMLALSQLLLHPLLAGFVLAAVLAAIMSTVSSQLIVCSSALVEDLYGALAGSRPPQRVLLLMGRGCVLAIAVIAALLALDPSDTILGLVSFAWAGFGASFGPVILLALFWRRLSTWGALAGMVAGTMTVFAWEAWGTDLYEIIPGFAAGLLIAVVVSLLLPARREQLDEIEQEFTEAAGLARRG
ncbi:sodium/proline symporter PutP [Sediminivirga luteola]|uniref:sodium/proline symporter PutP n=1 Tax=Sediminivirga luteola TaxID=1774748 RepID=UPI0030D76848